MSETNAWTSVSLPYVTGDARNAWATEAQQHGHDGTHKLLAVQETDPSPAVVAALGLALGESAIVRRRVMLLDQHPVELTDSYYPPAIARRTRLADPRKIPGGAPALLTTLGYPARQVQEDVSARLATPAEQQALELEDGDCVLILFRITTTDGNRPIEASIMTMVARGRHLRYQLNI